MRRLVAALGLAMMATAAPGAPPTPPLFSCRDADWTATLIGTEDGRLLLETRPSARGMGNVASSWEEVREGYVGGQGGGHQSHLRLFDGFRQIILFEGEDGSLADRPGRTYAGALTITESNPQQDFRIDCAATPDNAALLDNVRAWAARTGAKPPLPEDEGGPFDAWF